MGNIIRIPIMKLRIKYSCHDICHWIFKKNNVITIIAANGDDNPIKYGRLLYFVLNFAKRYIVNNGYMPAEKIKIFGIVS